MRRRILWIVGGCLMLVSLYLLTTDNPAIWPYRNALQYYLLTRGNVPQPPNAYEVPTTTASPQIRSASALQLPPTTPRGTLQGNVRSQQGQPIAGATVLVTANDGTAFSAESDTQGRYEIRDVPAGKYIPVAGAPGFADTAIRTLLGIGVRAEEATTLDITLAPRPASRVAPATNVTLSAPQALQIAKPLPATAVRRELKFRADGRSNQLTYVYTPNDGQTTLLPTLLAVYPGPADGWESVSMPLAQAGYAVVAVGPAYALDLEADIDDLERVVQLIKAGKLPRADGSQIGALAGSFSGLHVMRLTVREPDAINSALLLGPPTDMFELRRQFEAGTFFPPFGLDQALIALGLPSREPERYFRYSVRYHARDVHVPVMLIHSNEDEVVPFTQSQLLADEFARLNKPHELHILEGMGHYLLATERTPAIDQLFATTTDFFEQTLQRVE